MAKRRNWLQRSMLALACLVLPAVTNAAKPQLDAPARTQEAASTANASRAVPADKPPAQPALVLALPAPARAQHGPRRAERPRLRWAQLRANAQVVQNNIGNAYTLQAGWAPQLAFGDSPVGLRLLAQISALRSVSKKVFAVPSAELLLTWRVASHLELDLGAGVQIWTVPQQRVRPLATAEAHYLPHRKMARFVRSAFVASSLGAPGGAGLQVRAGLSFDFHRQTAVSPAELAVNAYISTPWAGLPTAQGSADAGHAVCPACPSAAPVADVPEDALLATRLLFAFNKANLNDAEIAYLQELGAALAAEPHAWKSLEIVGHADSIGTDAHTQKVSERRAERVRGVLVEAGISPERITVRAVGEHQPIVGERPDAASQRRVTLRLHGLHDSARLAGFVHSPVHPTEATP